MGDDDDYFHTEAELPCIPDVPESLRSESDSMDLDELPCIVPDDLILQSKPVEAARSASPEEHQLPGSLAHASAAKRLTPAAASITRSEPLRRSLSQMLCDLLTLGGDLVHVCNSACAHLQGIGEHLFYLLTTDDDLMCMPRTADLHICRALFPIQGLKQTPKLKGYMCYAVDEAMDGHRDAASGRVPLRKAVDAIGTSIRAAADRRRKSGLNPVMASESYEEDEYEEAEDMEDDGAVLPPE